MISQDRPMVLVITTVILMVVIVAWGGIGLLRLSRDFEFPTTEIMSWVPFVGQEQAAPTSKPALSDAEEEQAADAGTGEVVKDVMVPETLGIVDYPVVKVEDQVSVFEEIGEREEKRGKAFSLVPAQ